MPGASGRIQEQATEGNLALVLRGGTRVGRVLESSRRACEGGAARWQVVWAHLACWASSWDPGPGTKVREGGPGGGARSPQALIPTVAVSLGLWQQGLPGLEFVLPVPQDSVLQPPR